MHHRSTLCYHSEVQGAPALSPRQGKAVLVLPNPPSSPGVPHLRLSCTTSRWRLRATGSRASRCERLRRLRSSSRGSLTSSCVVEMRVCNVLDNSLQRVGSSSTSSASKREVHTILQTWISRWCLTRIHLARAPAYNGRPPPHGIALACWPASSASAGASSRLPRCDRKCTSQRGVA
jgi:hypothetical protein